MTLLELHAKGQADGVVVHLDQIPARSFDYAMRMVMVYYQGKLAPDEDPPDDPNAPRIEVTADITVSIKDQAKDER